MVSTGSCVILISLSVIYFLENYNRYLLAVSIIPFINYSSYNYSLLSGTVFGLCYSAGGIILAIANDSASQANKNPGKLIKRKIYCLAMACMIFSGAFILTAVSTNFAELAVIRMIMGFAQSIVTPFCTGIIGEYFPESLKGFAFGFFQLGTYFSFSLSLSLGTFMYDEYGWKYGYIVFGAVGLVVSLGIPFLACLNPVLALGDEDSSVATIPTSVVSFPEAVKGHHRGTGFGESKTKRGGWAGGYSIVYEEDGDVDNIFYDVNCSDAVILPPSRSADSKSSGQGLLANDLSNHSRSPSSSAQQPSQQLQPYCTLSSGLLHTAVTGNANDVNSNNKDKESANGDHKPGGSSDNISDVSCSMGSAGSFVEGMGGKEHSPSRRRDDLQLASSPNNNNRLALPISNRPSTLVYSPMAADRQAAVTRTPPPHSTTRSSAPGSTTSARDIRDRDRDREREREQERHRERERSDDPARNSLISVSLLSVRDSEAVRHGVISTPPSTDNDSLGFCCCGSANGKVDMTFREHISFWFSEAKDLCLEVLRSWNEQPVIYIVCIATGLRLGAGYIWSTYTSVYFSELFIADPNQPENDCLFSFNATAYALKSIKMYPSEACGPDYPYCTDTSGSGTCSRLSSNAWMNKGMPHHDLESFMSWVPLAGSAVGNVVGGLLSDRMFRYFGSGGRCLVTGLGNLVSILFVVEALLSEFPNCFLFMIVSGLFGECYLGQSIALLSDATPPRVVVTSVAIFMFIVTVIAGNAPLLVPAVADIFQSKFEPVTIFFSSAIIYPGKIPSDSADLDVNSSLPADHHHQLYFEDKYGFPSTTFSVTVAGGGSRSLQWSLIAIFISLYVSSGALYVVCYVKYRSLSSMRLSFSDTNSYNNQLGHTQRKS